MAFCNIQTRTHGVSKRGKGKDDMKLSLFKLEGTRKRAKERLEIF